MHLKHEIENGLKGIEYQIEHVGSTSIPNLDSKAIIDIDIIYENELEFEKIKSEKMKAQQQKKDDKGSEDLINGSKK